MFSSPPPTAVPVDGNPPKRERNHLPHRTLLGGRLGLPAWLLLSQSTYPKRLALRPQPPSNVLHDDSMAENSCQLMLAGKAGVADSSCWGHSRWKFWMEIMKSGTDLGCLHAYLPPPLATFSPTEPLNGRAEFRRVVASQEEFKSVFCDFAVKAIYS